MMRLFAAILLLACLGYAYVHAQAVSGFCVASDGHTAQTTVLDGGGYYPSPEVTVAQVDGGFVVEARVLFRRARVWMPWVER